MKTKLNTILFISALFVIQACAGSKVVTQAPQSSIDLSPQEPASMTAGPSKKQLLSYVLRLTNPENEFTTADAVFLEAITQNNSNKFAEAALVIGHIRSALVAKTAAQPDLSEDQAPDFDEQKNGEDTETNLATYSIKEKLEASNIDLLLALRINVALKNHNLYSQVLRALHKSSDQAEWKEKIQNHIYDEAHEWAALLPTATNLEVEEEIIEEDGEQQPENLSFSPGDLQRGDNILEHAQDLAEQGKFREAIKSISQISEQDPLSASAREQAKNYSNLAVQALRQKAAQAYQNAMPSGDPITKLSYLDQARLHLESAINDFPDADQIDTVKQNLAVITKDLEKVKQQKTVQEGPSE